ELLDCPTARLAAERAAEALARNEYAGCNFLCADRDRAVILHGGDWLRVRPLPPGLHVLTNHDVNDPSDRRATYALDWLSQRHVVCADQVVTALRELCPQPGNGTAPMCLHGEQKGTVSSSILALKTPRQRSVLLHAQGPPDRVPYEDYSALLRDLFAVS